MKQIKPDKEWWGQRQNGNHTPFLKIFTIELNKNVPKLNACGLNSWSKHMTCGNAMIVGFYRNKFISLAFPFLIQFWRYKTYDDICLDVCEFCIYVTFTIWTGKNCYWTFLGFFFFSLLLYFALILYPAFPDIRSAVGVCMYWKRRRDISNLI